MPGGDLLWFVAAVLLALGCNVLCILVGFRLGRVTADKAPDIAIRGAIGSDRPIDIPVVEDEFREAERQYQRDNERVPTI